MLSEVNKVSKDNPIFVSQFLFYFAPPAYFDPPRLIIFQNPWSLPAVYFDPPVYYEPESISIHWDYTLFIKEQFYKNNEAQICPKIKNKLRTIEARLQMQI